VVLLDSDLTRARTEAALAGSFTARLLVLSKELDALAKRERELMREVDIGDGDTDYLRDADIQELHEIFTAEEKVHPGTFELVCALLLRRANLEAIAGARAERERLLRQEMDASDKNARYSELATRWISVNSQGDPGRGMSLTKLEKEEREGEQQALRMEEADAAAGEAEHALECLRVILHDAVDWVPGETAREADTAILRAERVGPADPWLGQAQVALSRCRRILEEMGTLDAGEVQVDLLTGFAEMCIQGLVRDLTEKDGIDRALRPVTRTLTTIRALRGHLARGRGNMRKVIDEVRSRRTMLLRRPSR